MKKGSYMNKKSLASALALALLSLNVLADDGFSGAYAGVQFGYVDGRDKGTEYDNGSPDGWTQQTKPSGGLFGLAAGFNTFLNNNILVGIEADIEHRVASDTSDQVYGGVADPTYPVETETKAAFSLRPRVGYLFNGNQTLVFVTAGYASADIKRTFNSVGGTPPSQSSSEWKDGWTAGLGLEHVVAKTLTAKVEYRYADFGSTNADSSLVFGSGYMEKQKYTEQSIRLGLMYHFR
jgi:outer membrane immunogenic protein